MKTYKFVRKLVLGIGVVLKWENRNFSEKFGGSRCEMAGGEAVVLERPPVPFHHAFQHRHELELAEGFLMVFIVADLGDALHLLHAVADGDDDDATHFQLTQ